MVWSIIEKLFSGFSGFRSALERLIASALRDGQTGEAVEAVLPWVSFAMNKNQKDDAQDEDDDADVSFFIEDDADYGWAFSRHSREVPAKARFDFYTPSRCSPCPPTSNAWTKRRQRTATARAGRTAAITRAGSAPTTRRARTCCSRRRSFQVSGNSTRRSPAQQPGMRMR